MLSRWQSTIVDAQGNVQPFAILTILNEETQAPAQIYASESESQPLPAGTVVADESGYAYFYAPGGRYRIQSADLNIDWRHVPLGDLQGMDEADLSSSIRLSEPIDQVPDAETVQEALAGLGALGTNFATPTEAQALDSLTKLISPGRLGDAMNAHVPGMGQTWQNVFGQRSANTTYTNTTGRAITIAVSISGRDSAGISYVMVNEINVSSYKNQSIASTGGTPADDNRVPLTALVPPGDTYRAAVVSGHSIVLFAELR